MLAFAKWKVRSGLLKDVLILTTGAGGAQILAMLLMPVITRIFSAENYGVMTTFSTFTTTIAVFVCGGYDQAINLPKEDKEAWSLFCLSICFAVAFGILLCIVTFVFELPITRFIFKSESDVLVYFLPLTVLLRGICMPMMFWMIRFRNFWTLSSTAFIGVAGNQGTKLVGGYLVGDKLSPLILGTFLYNLFPCFWFGVGMYRNTPRKLFRFPKKLDLVSVLYEYRKFPLYATWVELLINLARSILVFLLASVYDNKVVGYYGLAYNALALPIALLATTVRQACLPRIASLINERKSVSALFLKILLGLTAALILPFAIIIAFGPELISFIFGSGWREAGVYAQILVPWFFTMLLISPASVVLTVTQNQAFRLIFHSILTGFQISVFMISNFLKMDIYTFLATLSIGSCVLYLGKIYYGYRFALNYRNE